MISSRDFLLVGLEPATPPTGVAFVGERNGFVSGGDDRDRGSGSDIGAGSPPSRS